MHPRACPINQCVRKRPKGVQRSGLRKSLNSQAEGGRFEPARRRGRVTRASALESLGCKGLRRPRAYVAAPPKTTLNNPGSPAKTGTGPGFVPHRENALTQATDRPITARRVPRPWAATSSPRSPAPRGWSIRPWSAIRSQPPAPCRTQNGRRALSAPKTIALLPVVAILTVRHDPPDGVRRASISERPSRARRPKCARIVTLRAR